MEKTMESPQVGPDSAKFLEIQYTFGTSYSFSINRISYFYPHVDRIYTQRPLHQIPFVKSLTHDNFNATLNTSHGTSHGISE